MERGPYLPPNAKIEDPPKFPGLVPGYTVALGAIAALFLVGALSLASITGNPELDEDLLWMYELSARVGLALAAITALVVALRVRESRYAPSATAILSVFLVLYVPFGTAAFIYWVVSVRKRERGWRAG